MSNSTGNSSFFETTGSSIRIYRDLNYLIIAIAAFAMISNIFAVVAIVRSGALAKNKFLWLILVLALNCAAVCFNAVLGGFPYPSAVVTNIGCYLFNLSFVIFDLQIEYIHLAIAIERFYLVIAPIHYRVHGDSATVGIIVAVIVASVLPGLLGFAGVHNDFSVMPHGCGFSLIDMNYFFFLYWFLGRNVVFVLSVGIYIGILVAAAIIGRKHKAAPNDRAAQQKAKRQGALTRMVIILIVNYCLTIGTSRVLLLVVVFGNIPTDSSAYSMLVLLLSLFGVLNGFFNIFIFPLKSDEVKQAMKKQANSLTCGLCGCLNNAVEPIVYSTKSHGRS